MLRGIIYLLITIYASVLISCHKDVLLVTIATERTDGFERWHRSAKNFGFTDIRVFGLDTNWRGGDVRRTTGGGQKINLLVEGLKDVANKKDLLVLFTDSYDVVFTQNIKKLLLAYDKLNCQVIFSAEDFCWPDISLVNDYPIVSPNESRFLNSGTYIGPASVLYEILTMEKISDTDDDQLYFTKIFLNTQLRKKYHICLDTRSEIFQCLNGALENVGVKFNDTSSFLHNYRSGYSPIIVHGNGPIKLKFNSLANYIGDQWNPTSGWKSWETIDNLHKFKDDDLPIILMAVFVYQPTAFITEFLEFLTKLDYPKSKIHLYLHNNVHYHINDTKKFLVDFGSTYGSWIFLQPAANLTEYEGRNRAVNECLRLNCHYYFAIDSNAHLSNEKVLKELIVLNKSVAAPLLTREGKTWSNFWGDLNENGFYARSEDYLTIINGDRIGVWNMPYVAEVLLIQSALLNKYEDIYIYDNFDPDMALCANIREKGYHMYVDNRNYYGYLVNSERFTTNHLHNDLISPSMMDNKNLWAKRYIHPDYWKALNEDSIIEQPCPDAFWTPIVSRRFCKELIEEAEFYGKWSGGGDKPSIDSRLGGGYENVPTVDIHMNQIGFEEQWLFFLREFVAPINLKLFMGYYTDARAHMNFIVRYKPKEQNHLKPHHDSSTYTINIALNEPNVDYEGGGVHFLRYKCKVVNLRVGWCLMHPGRLTHYHEGLTTTNGTRYIMVSFIDP